MPVTFFGTSDQSVTIDLKTGPIVVTPTNGAYEHNATEQEVAGYVTDELITALSGGQSIERHYPLIEAEAIPDPALHPTNGLTTAENEQLFLVLPQVAGWLYRFDVNGVQGQYSSSNSYTAPVPNDGQSYDVVALIDKQDGRSATAIQHTYTAFIELQPSLLPVNGSVLEFGTQEFSVQNADAGHLYRFDVNGVNGVYSSSSSIIANVVSDGPSGGQFPVTLRINKQDGSPEIVITHEYESSYDAESDVELSGPVSGSILTSTTPTFTFDNGGDNTIVFGLHVSATPFVTGVFKIGDLYESRGIGTDLSHTLATALPDDNQTKYVRLYYTRTNGVLGSQIEIIAEGRYIDAQYTIDTSGSMIPTVSITSPSAGTVFTSRRPSFAFSNGGDNSVVFGFHLSSTPFETGVFKVGNLYESRGIGTDLTHTIASDLPEGQYPVYSRLYYTRTGGVLGTSGEIIEEGRYVDADYSVDVAITTTAAQRYTRVKSNPAAALAIMQNLCGHRPVTRPAVTGTLHTVNSASTFSSANSVAVSGDEIRFAPGNYSGLGNLTLTGSANVLFSGVGVTFSGDTRIYSIGANKTVFGFKLYQCSSRFQIEISSAASNCKVLGCEIDRPISSGSSYDVGILARGDDCEVADNFIHDTPKLFFGVFNGSSLNPEAFRPYTHHNTFKDSISDGGLGGSALRVGLAGNDINGTVEYNRFDNWNGDGETMEIKGSGNAISYNLMTNCGFGHTSNRWGHNNVYYANYSDDAKWNLRFNGDGNKGYFNYTKSSATGFYQAFTFFLRASTPNVYANNVGANNNTLKHNISEGFLTWVSTLAQGDAPYFQIQGNEISDNIYLGTDNVGVEAGYLADDNEQPWSDYDAQNTHTNNISIPLDAASGDYISPIERDVPQSVDGYEPPVWWSEMFE